MSLNLKEYIQDFQILNIDEENSTHNAMEFALNDKPNNKTHISSNVDAELLILVKFRKNVNLDSIKLYQYGYENKDDHDLCDASTPKQIRIYKIDNLNLNFMDIQSLKCDKSITIPPPNSNRMQSKTITLKDNSKNAIKFKKLQYLAVYIASNHKEPHNSTYLNGISFIGNIDDDPRDNVILIEDEKTQSQSILAPLNELKLSVQEAYNNVDKSCLSVASATVSNTISVVNRSSTLLHHKKLFESITTLDECIGLMSQSNQCIAENICNDPSKLQTLKTFLEQNKKTFGSKLLGDNPDTNTVKTCVKSICDKGKKLAKVCSDKAFRQKLNWIHGQYIASSAVFICLSFAEIYVAFQSIKDSTQTMEEYREKMNELYVEEILPIMRYRDKVVNHGTIYDRDECQIYMLKISCALKQLHQYKPVIEAEKQKCTQLGVGNTVASISMLFSGMMSVSRVSNKHDMSKMLYVIAALQVIAAAAHAYVAYKAYKQHKELCKLEEKLNDSINQLSQVKESLEAWEGDKYPLSQRDSYHLGDVSSWNNERVLQWVEQQGNNYDVIYKMFKEKNMKGKDLLKLSHGQLAAIGVQSLFKRKQLLRKIAQLKSQS